MGFETGNILEPSMGVGNFFGMLPEKMRNSRLYGVELDPVSGRIAKQLYPKAVSYTHLDVYKRQGLYPLRCRVHERAGWWSAGYAGDFPHEGSSPDL